MNNQSRLASFFKIVIGRADGVNPGISIYTIVLLQ